MGLLIAAPLAVTLTSALSGAGWDAQGSTAQRVRDELRREFPQLDPHATTITYCASGYRSSAAAAASTLRAHGFGSVADLVGGYDAWTAAIRPAVPHAADRNQGVPSMNPFQPEASPTEAHRRGSDVVLLDVRELDEWSAGHAPGARHMPLGTVDASMLADDATVLCVCRSGGRSALATESLRQAGVDARNVTGGMQAWAEAALPIVTDDDRPGTVA